MNTPPPLDPPRLGEAEIPEVLKPWVTVWSARGLPRTLLIELGIHLLASGSATISKAEEDQVLSILNQWARLEREDPEFSVEKALEALAPPTPLTVEAYEMLGQRQRDRVSKLKRDHPLLRLWELDHQICALGFRAAVEEYIGHKPDPRRKHTDTGNKSDWCTLLSTMDPILEKRLKEFCSGSRKRTGLLVGSIVGIKERQQGLLEVLETLFADGTPQRIRSVHDQARLRASGSKIAEAPGMTKGADIAAGLQRSLPVETGLSTPTKGVPKAQRTAAGAGKHWERAKEMHDRAVAKERAKRAKARSLKARQRAQKKPQ